MHDEFREALKLPDLPLKSAAAALRHRIPQIEQFMAQGVARETIVEEFRRQGVGVTVHGLSTFLSRERKERERSSRSGLASGPPQERATPATTCPPALQEPQDIAHVKGKHEQLSQPHDPEALRVTLGNNVAKRRRQLRLTQEAVARSMETAQSYIAHLEHGRKNPNTEVLSRLAAALQTDVASLVSSEDEASVRFGIVKPAQ